MKLAAVVSVLVTAHCGLGCATRTAEPTSARDRSSPSATRPPSEPAPTASSAAADGEGLDAQQIRPVVKQSYPAVRGCHTIEHAGRGKPQAGHVTVDLLIQSDGSVAEASVQDSSFTSDQLHQCVIGIARQLVFPAAQGSTELSWKFRFAGAGGHMAKN